MRQFTRFACLFFFLLLTFGFATNRFSVKANVLNNNIFIPISVGGSGSSTSACTPSAKETAIANLMINHTNQGRATMTCDPILEQVARERAQDMGQRAYIGHVNPDGHGPNYLVEQAGYMLPNSYGNSITANYIESIAAGYQNPNNTWNNWMGSPSHKTHLLGEDAFYAAQIEYGVGHVTVPGSPYLNYWVVITARPGP